MGNSKNKDKRRSASLNALAHNRLKELSKTSGLRMERMIDDAVFLYLKMHVTAPMIRGTGE